MKDNKIIPEFNNADEEAKYWEEHDILTHWDELEPATIKIAKPRKKQISIRFNPEVLDGVQRIAEEKGIPYQTLIQSWVVERLKKEKASVLAAVTKVKRTVQGRTLYSRKA